MKNINIVVIDSGVDIEHPIFKNCLINGICIYRNINNLIVKSNNIIDEIGHGTAVCGILVKFCTNVNIYMVKIYNNELITDEDILIKALEYINNNIKCDIIHMSLGIMTPSIELENVCKQLYKKKIIMVSAFDNTGAVSYPAAYKEVIGVDASIKCIYPLDYIFVENSIVNIYAKGGNSRLAWLNKEYIISKGISFSAAFATSIIANLYYNYFDNINLQLLNNLLKKNAIDIYHFDKVSIVEEIKIKEFISGKKAAIFPYNKEIHSLINFSELLQLEIENIYDISQHGFVNKKVKSLDEKKEFKIKNYLDIDYKSINIMIIGHLQELSRLVKRNLKDDILEKCLENNISVYCFDDDFIDKYINKFKNKNLFIFSPIIGENYKYVQKMGKLYGIKSPIIGIFGTSSSQGKFTFQLQLRKLFLEHEYTIGQLGSEPSALLFGMDEVFAFGYSARVELDTRQYIEAINELIHNIDLKNPDIIIAGCQSATIPKIYYNVDHINLLQLNFLLGLNPDIVILCVNIFDDIDYIQRCIYTIENIVECKIPVLAISPLYYLNEWNMMNNKKDIADKEKIINFKRNLETKLNLKSFVIGTKEIDELFQICINYLSE